MAEKEIRTPTDRGKVSPAWGSPHGSLATIEPDAAAFIEGIL